MSPKTHAHAPIDCMNRHGSAQRSCTEGTQDSRREGVLQLNIRSENILKMQLSLMMKREALQKLK
jgi:hypothetical protein